MQSLILGLTNTGDQSSWTVKRWWFVWWWSLLKLMFRNYTHTHFTYSATNKKVSSAVLAYTLGFFFLIFFHLVLIMSGTPCTSMNAKKWHADLVTELKPTVLAVSRNPLRADAYSLRMSECRNIVLIAKDRRPHGVWKHCGNKPDDGKHFQKSNFTSSYYVASQQHLNNWLNQHNHNRIQCTECVKVGFVFSLYKHL